MELLAFESQHRLLGIQGVQAGPASFHSQGHDTAVSLIRWHIAYSITGCFRLESTGFGRREGSSQAEKQPYKQLCTSSLAKSNLWHEAHLSRCQHVLLQRACSCESPQLSPWTCAPSGRKYCGPTQVAANHAKGNSCLQRLRFNLFHSFGTCVDPRSAAPSSCFACIQATHATQTTTPTTAGLRTITPICHEHECLREKLESCGFVTMQRSKRNMLAMPAFGIRVVEQVSPCILLHRLQPIPSQLPPRGPPWPRPPPPLAPPSYTPFFPSVSCLCGILRPCPTGPRQTCLDLFGKSSNTSSEPLLGTTRGFDRGPA